MRRAVHHGMAHRASSKPFLHDGRATTWSRKMGDVYPELLERASLIGKSVTEEEQRFRETLDRGAQILDERVRRRPRATKAIAGAVAFKLYDTYGFPLDLTRVIAERARLCRRRGGLRGRDGRAAQAQRVPRLGRSRRRRRVQEGRGARRRHRRSAATKARAGHRRWWRCSPTARKSTPSARYSKRVALITAETPFYGESGGQVGDAGVIRSAKAKLRVDDVKRPVPTLVRAPRRGDRGRAARRRHGRAGGRHRAPRRHPPQSLGDAPAALGAAHRARRARHAEGLAGRAGSAALRLLALRAADARGAPARRGSRERARARQPARADRRAGDRRGQEGAARSPSSARSTATPCAS